MPKYLAENKVRDFPGGPVVKTSAFNAGGAGSIPGRGAKFPHASRPKHQNIKQKQYCNKFNKDLKKKKVVHIKKVFKEKKKRKQSESSLKISLSRPQIIYYSMNTCKYNIQ